MPAACAISITATPSGSSPYVACVGLPAGPVTVTARPGWLVNGRESVSYPSAKGLSGGLKFTSRLGEDHSCCPSPPTSNDVHCTDFVIGATANPPNVIVLYAVPATSAVVTASASSKVAETGAHQVTLVWEEWECDVCGARQEVRTEVSHYDVEPDTYAWTDCGRCAFVGQTSAEAVVYGATDETGGSESYLAEDLTVAATVRNADGLSASATCMTNFTVVAVDVSLGNWGELMDEKNDTVISSYVKRDGTGWFEGYPDLAEEAMTKCPVEIEVLPENLPAEEKVRIAFEDDNLRGLERMYELETVRPNYDLLCFNCTDAAISIGRACGAPVPAGGLPDLSALESIRGGLSGDLDWAQSILNLWKDSDGSYSCPLFLMWNLNIINEMYGVKE